MAVLMVALEFFATIYLLSNFAAAFQVNVKNGKLEGTIIQTRRGRECFAYRSIPYALPPVGDLRFEPPQPAIRWGGVRQAVQESPMCVQKDIITLKKDVSGQEDCLYLNVYTLKPPSEYENKLAVMVWIHGGGWLAGNAAEFGPEFLLDHDVVLVTINYRLGPLGFLSTGDMTAPGNMGMKDQVLALKWVQENIAAFGGDPSRVTIFGESAGSSSVHYHMMSPLSKGLFHRAIMQSGTTLNPWGLIIPGAVKTYTKELAEKFGCPVESSTKLVDCLRQQDAAALTDTGKILQKSLDGPPLSFIPVVEPDHEGAFLTDMPLEILKSKNIADVPVMMGMTSHEGSIVVAPIFEMQQYEFLKKLNENWTDIAPSMLLLDYIFSHRIEIEDIENIKKFYFNDRVIDESSKWTLIDMVSDAVANIGLDSTIKYQLEAALNPVYYYSFAYKGSASYSSLFGGLDGDYGVCHGDELQYLFPTGKKLFPNTQLNENDHKIIDYLTTLWYNFAKTGNPTPEINRDIPIEWKPIKTEAYEYLLIKDPENIRMSVNLNEYRTNFWRSLLRKAEKKNSSETSSVKIEL